MRLRVSRLAPISVIAVLICCGSASAATIWTPLSSGTTTDISSVAAPSASEILYTAGTTIEYDTSTGFKLATLTPTPALPLTAISMSSDGTTGVAVGQHGEIYHTTNSGVTWTQVTGTQEYPASGSGSCSSGGFTGLAPLSDNLLAVDVAPSSVAPYTVYITGANNDILKSINGGASFSEVNKHNTAQTDPTDSGEEYCVIHDPFSGDLTGTDWLSPSVGFFVSNQFGNVFQTTDGVGNTEGGSTDLRESINGFDEQTEITVDAADPSLIWTVAGGGSSEGVAYSTNGGSSWQLVNFESSQTNTLLSIASVGTTVVAVGDDGDIWTSSDGVNFYEQDAPAPLDTTNWNSVAMVPGTNEAIVGGDGGALVETTTANEIPDTVAPTGSITGPTSLTVGQTGTFTVSATDNPGGSGVNPSSYSCSSDNQTQTGATVSFTYATAGTYTISCTFADNSGNVGSATSSVIVGSAPGSTTPTTTTPAPTPTPTPAPKPVTATPAPSGTLGVIHSAEGATVEIYRKVTITGRDARYIPINVDAKAKRLFVVELLSVPKRHKRQRRYAIARVTLRGRNTIKLTVPKSVHTGSYQIEVTVYTVGSSSRRTGSTVKQVFVLS
jgi:photosystem II stability/assembly factor-like uncharacterized protein